MLSNQINTILYFYVFFWRGAAGRYFQFTSNNDLIFLDLSSLRKISLNESYPTVKLLKAVNCYWIPGKLWNTIFGCPRSHISAIGNQSIISYILLE